MKRALSSLLLLLALAIPATAIADKWVWEGATMRSTSAASVAANRKWNAGPGSTGFVDSSVFRRGATTMTVYDTTVAFPQTKFLYPPSVGAFTTQTDSTQNWIAVRVKQDTTSANFAGGTGLTSSAMDSIRVAAEYSYNGSVWFSCSGTPTYRFDVVFLTSGEDGLQSPTLVGVENSPGEDAIVIPYKWVAALQGAQAYIVNKQLAFAGQYIRFIIGGDYSGQFAVELGHWEKD